MAEASVENPAARGEESLEFVGFPIARRCLLCASRSILNFDVATYAKFGDETWLDSKRTSDAEYAPSRKPRESRK